MQIEIQQFESRHRMELNRVNEQETILRDLQREREQLLEENRCKDLDIEDMKVYYSTHNRMKYPHSQRSNWIIGKWWLTFNILRVSWNQSFRMVSVLVNLLKISDTKFHKRREVSPNNWVNFNKNVKCLNRS